MTRPSMVERDGATVITLPDMGWWNGDDVIVAVIGLVVDKLATDGHGHPGTVESRGRWEIDMRRTALACAAYLKRWDSTMSAEDVEELSAPLIVQFLSANLGSLWD